MLFHLNALYFLISLSSFAFGTIYLFDKNGNFTMSVEDMPSLFGPEIDGQFEGYLSLTDPLNACTRLKPPRDGHRTLIGLAKRGNCSFIEKALNAQQYYAALIVFDNVNEGLLPMDGDSEKIVIPSFFITLASGNMLLDHHAVGNYTLIKPGGSSYLLLYLIPFILFLLLILIALVIFLIYRVIMNYRASRKLALSRTQLRKLKKMTFKKGQCNYETCAICIEDYVNGDKLRILPCNHAYHCKCIDKWLLKRRRVCPICKHVIRFPGEVIDSDIEHEPRTGENSQSQSLQNPVQADTTQQPEVSVIQPRRKRRNQNPEDPSQPQASTSALDRGQDSSTDVTDGEPDAHMNATRILSKVANRLKSTFSSNAAEASEPVGPRRLLRKRRPAEDRAPLVIESERSSNLSSGHSTPAFERSESPNGSNINQGFAPENSPDLESSPAQEVAQLEAPKAETLEKNSEQD